MGRTQDVAARVIREHGMAYPVAAELGQYDFPARFYGELFVPAGRYSALRVAIGQAAGANWWCVLFPPMCFLDWSSGVVLEPKPGSGGTQTVTVQRPALVDEEAIAKAPVKARFAVVDWAKKKLSAKRTPR